jgi:glycosyltransferase involved in cell wall biosynthesis
VTLVEDPWQFEHCRRSRRSGPIVLSTHNVQAVRFAMYAGLQGAPPGSRRSLRLIERVEARAVRQADLVLAVSAIDRAQLVERYAVDPDRVVEVPNGADTERHTPSAPDEKARAKRALRLPDRPTVLFVGGNIAPNRASLAWILRLAERSSRFTFLVVGPVSRPRRGECLVATGEVDDVEPYLQAADLAICPTEFGSGTKIKLFESLSAGLPTVLFAEAARGTTLRDEEHVLIPGKTERELLLALDRLVDEPLLARRLAEAGRAFVVAHHDRATIASRLDTVLRGLVGAGEVLPAPVY